MKLDASMKDTEESLRKVRSKAARDLSIDYLRTTITLMVIAHHSALAYTTWAQFSARSVFLSSAPVVDAKRWAVLDYAENFNDVFFMSLMFFVSGLFVLPAIRKHGAALFMRDRLLRLGLPFVAAVALLIPIAYYPMWNLTERHSSYWSYYVSLASQGFTVGPPWFIWVLLLFDIALATMLHPFPRLYKPLKHLSTSLASHPGKVCASMLVLTATAYLPLLQRYGFSKWTVLISSPFAFQQSRIALYALWFLFGALVGVAGVENGFLSRASKFIRGWRWWVGVCVAAYNLLWFVPRSAFVAHHLGGNLGRLEASLWVLSCVASCFCLLAVFRAVRWKANPWMLSLSRAAYAMYLVHYVFVTWAQRTLLAVSVPAYWKVMLVFVSATLLSWLAAQALLRIRPLANVL